MPSCLSYVCLSLLVYPPRGCCFACMNLFLHSKKVPNPNKLFNNYLSISAIFWHFNSNQYWAYSNCFWKIVDFISKHYSIVNNLTICIQEIDIHFHELHFIILYLIQHTVYVLIHRWFPLRIRNLFNLFIVPCNFLAI